jgi:hypothetical protein
MWQGAFTATWEARAEKTQTAVAISPSARRLVRLFSHLDDSSQVPLQLGQISCACHLPRNLHRKARFAVAPASCLARFQGAAVRFVACPKNKRTGHGLLQTAYDRFSR